MKGFDLYRITLAYLGVIFVMCAAVVFDPLRWVWPAAAPLLVAVPGGDGLTRTAARPVAEPAPPQPAQSTAVGPADPAEIVAAQVAETYFAKYGEDLGEGDISAQGDADLSPEAAMVAAGSDVAYTVGPGESLGSLALRFYGDSALASMIFDANRGLMASPDQLRVGQIIIIPGRS